MHEQAYAYTGPCTAIAIWHLALFRFSFTCKPWIVFDVTLFPVFIILISNREALKLKKDNTTTNLCTTIRIRLDLCFLTNLARHKCAKTYINLYSYKLILSKVFVRNINEKTSLGFIWPLQLQQKQLLTIANFDFLLAPTFEERKIWERKLMGHENWQELGNYCPLLYLLSCDLHLHTKRQAPNYRTRFSLEIGQRLPLRDSLYSKFEDTKRSFKEFMHNPWRTQRMHTWGGKSDILASKYCKLKFLGPIKLKSLPCYFRHQI